MLEINRRKSLRYYRSTAVRGLAKMLWRVAEFIGALCMKAHSIAINADINSIEKHSDKPRLHHTNAKKDGKILSLHIACKDLKSLSQEGQGSRSSV